MISSFLIQKIVLGVVIVLFVIVSSLAVVHGIRAAHSRAILSTVHELERALDFFLKDQTRYPSAQEFATISTFGQYLSSWPVPRFISGSCAESFSYRQTGLKHYELSFCLPAPAEGLASGIHILAR
jgi:hypothetical protein